MKTYKRENTLFTDPFFKLSVFSAILALILSIVEDIIVTHPTNLPYYLVVLSVLSIPSLLFSSLFFIFIGIFLLRENNRAEKKYTAEVKAVVVENKHQVARLGSLETIDIKPVFGYSYNNIEYKIDFLHSGTGEKYKVGSEVDLLIDPLNPEDATLKQNGLIMAFICVFPFIIGSIFLIKAVKDITIFILGK